MCRLVMHIRNAEGDFAIDKIPSKHDDMDLLHAVTLFESFNSSSSVNKLLLAGEERMTCRADFGMNLFVGGTCHKAIAAETLDGYFLIRRVNSLFH